jgi:hypothetical protein
MCGVWMYLITPILSKKRLPKNFHFISFLKLDTLFHKLLEKSGLFVVEGNYDYNRVNS